MRRGSFALILHAHLPFVRHPEHAEFLEEQWLFEAITETYLPLIAMMQRLVRDGVPFRIAMSITPTLCAMLGDELLRERYVQYLDRTQTLIHRELDRTRGDEHQQAMAQFYLRTFEQRRTSYINEFNRDLVAAFRALRDAGALEVLACAATHAVLPLLAWPADLRSQLAIGRDEFIRHFGAPPVGWWLPECAYSPQIGRALQEANVRWFVLDAHGLLYGKPIPRSAIYAPCHTPAGPAAFARDRETSRQVWSAHEGYPGDPVYRDFYRDIGFDLSDEQLGQPRGRFTGLKYHRVTGADVDKQFYEPEAAQRRAQEHAEHFLQTRQHQFDEIASTIHEPIIVAPFDAELFGHWWFEGPQFLEHFIRKTAEQDAFGLTTPTEYLERNPTQQTLEPATSSWGANGYFEVWLNDKNAWIQPHLRAAGKLMRDAARQHVTHASAFAERLLKQLARELLLAQASDWPFLIHAGTASDYASRRAKDHLVRFNKLHQQLAAGRADEDVLRDCEWRDSIFPELNWRYFTE